MKNINLVCYWLVCVYIISIPVLLGEWQMFVDQMSIQAVISPAIVAIFIYPKNTISEKLTLSLKAAWLSGVILFVIGVIQVFSATLNGYEIDFKGVFVGLAVALLPILYCLVISLFYAPLTFLSKATESKPVQ